MLLLTLVYAGCISEDSIIESEKQNEISVRVNLSILAQAGQKTRAWQDANAFDDIEMMKKWIIVITDTENKIEKIINSTFSADTAGEREIDYS